MDTWLKFTSILKTAQKINDVDIFLQRSMSVKIKINEKNKRCWQWHIPTEKYVSGHSSVALTRQSLAKYSKKLRNKTLQTAKLPTHFVSGMGSGKHKGYFVGKWNPDCSASVLSSNLSRVLSGVLTSVLFGVFCPYTFLIFSSNFNCLVCLIAAFIWLFFYMSCSKLPCAVGYIDLVAVIWSECGANIIPLNIIPYYPL